MDRPDYNTAEESVLSTGLAPDPNNDYIFWLTIVVCCCMFFMTMGLAYALLCIQRLRNTTNNIRKGVAGTALAQAGLELTLQQGKKRIVYQLSKVALLEALLRHLKPEDNGVALAYDGADPSQAAAEEFIQHLLSKEDVGEFHPVQQQQPAAAAAPDKRERPLVDV